MLNNQDSTQSNKDQTSNSVDGCTTEQLQIEGLDNFSFTNLPQEELELKDQFENFIETMRLNEVKLQK